MDTRKVYSQQLREYGHSLIKRGQQCLTAADLLEEIPADLSLPPDINLSHRAVPDYSVTPSVKNTKSEGKPDRIVQLTKFLRENGPQLSSEILKATGIPRGTFSFITSKYKGRFERTDDGRWSVTEE